MSLGSCNVSTRFVLGGEAIFTLSNGKGDHMTFRVNTVEGSSRYPTPTSFASVLTGSDNTSDYTYVGRVMVNYADRLVTDPSIKRTAKSKFPDDSRVMMATKFALRAIWQIERGTYTLPTGYTIHHSGKCPRCGNRLTTPESISTGFGPDCAAALGIEWGAGDHNRIANTGVPKFTTLDLKYDEPEKWGTESDAVPGSEMARS